MCLFKLAELYCVSTKILRMSELMQFETGMSMSRYLPPSGTAGFERNSVSGDRRVPAPPPRITARMFGLFGAMAHTFPVLFGKLFDVSIDAKRRAFQARAAREKFSYCYKRVFVRGRTVKEQNPRARPAQPRAGASDEVRGAGVY